MAVGMMSWKHKIDIFQVGRVDHISHINTFPDMHALMGTHTKKNSLTCLAPPDKADIVASILHTRK